VPRVRRALEDPANEKWLSPISVWELVILVEKKRVFLTMSVDEWVAQSMAMASLNKAPSSQRLRSQPAQRACPTEIRLTHFSPLPKYSI
jgi:PIN domain nuclease of toxin-antitoxin system